jgi:hypothetical protein
MMPSSVCRDLSFMAQVLGINIVYLANSNC